MVSFVEALYAGLPIVTSAVGGALELVDGDCGYLLPPGDSEAITDALRALIVDGDMRARMGSVARNRPTAICDPRVEMLRLHQVLAAHSPAAEEPLAALAG